MMVNLSLAIIPNNNLVSDDKFTSTISDLVSVISKVDQVSPFHMQSYGVRLLQALSKSTSRGLRRNVTKIKTSQNFQLQALSLMLCGP